MGVWRGTFVWLVDKSWMKRQRREDFYTDVRKLALFFLTCEIF